MSPKPSCEARWIDTSAGPARPSATRSVSEPGWPSESRPATGSAKASISRHFTAARSISAPWASPSSNERWPGSSWLRLALRPARVGIARAGGGDIGRPDQHGTTRLDLLDVHGLGDVRPAVIELDFAKEGVEVDIGQRLAHAIRGGRASPLDRHLEGETGGGGRGGGAGGLPQLSTEIVDADRIAGAIENIQPFRLGVAGSAGRDLRRQTVAGGEKCHRVRFRVLRQRHVDDTVKQPAARGDHTEEPVVMGIEDGVRRGTAADHRHLMLLADHGGPSSG